MALFGALLMAFTLAACGSNSNSSGSGGINPNPAGLNPIPHVGAAHETHGIVFALELPYTDWQVRSIQIGADHGGFGYGENTLTIFYEPHSDFEGEISERIDEVFFESTADRLFYLIGNLQAVTFSVNHERTAGEIIRDYGYRFSITRNGTRLTSGEQAACKAAGGQSDSSSIVAKITAIERDAETNATSHFYVRFISEALVDTGYGMNDDLGGCVLVFELENISGRAIAADITAVFPGEYGESATLIDQNVRFEPGQARQFTHSFGEYVFTPSLHLVIEYMNVRYGV